MKVNRIKILSTLHLMPFAELVHIACKLGLKTSHSNSDMLINRIKKALK